jgi:hypothetical protein
MPRRATTIPDAPVNEDPIPQTIDERRKEALDGVMQLAQFGCLAFGNFADAGAIGLHGPPLVKEGVDLAGKNKAVAAKVDLLIEYGPYAGLVAAALPFVVQILCNHGLLKANQWANAGVVSAETLEYQMKATIAEQQMDALRKQREAEEALRKMADEMRESANGTGEYDPDNVQEDVNAE